MSLLCGLYLLNLYRLPYDTPADHLSVPRLVFSLVFLGLAFYLMPALFRVGPEGDADDHAGEQHDLDGGFGDHADGGERGAWDRWYCRSLGLIPAGRMGTAQEMAAAVAFLASPVSSFTSGTNLVVDGALTRGVQL